MLEVNRSIITLTWPWMDPTKTQASSTHLQVANLSKLGLVMDRRVRKSTSSKFRQRVLRLTWIDSLATAPCLDCKPTQLHFRAKTMATNPSHRPLLHLLPRFRCRHSRVIANFPTACSSLSTHTQILLCLRRHECILNLCSFPHPLYPLLLQQTTPSPCLLFTHIYPLKPITIRLQPLPPFTARTVPHSSTASASAKKSSSSASLHPLEARLPCPFRNSSPPAT